MAEITLPTFATGIYRQVSQADTEPVKSAILDVHKQYDALDIPHSASKGPGFTIRMVTECKGTDPADKEVPASMNLREWSDTERHAYEDDLFISTAGVPVSEYLRQVKIVIDLP